MICIKTNILPRQARDKHRENSPKRGPFSHRADAGQEERARVVLEAAAPATLFALRGDAVA
jgi:hypothetical protein